MNFLPESNILWNNSWQEGDPKEQQSREILPKAKPVSDIVVNPEILRRIERWFSKCGPHAGSINTTSELYVNAISKMLWG